MSLESARNGIVAAIRQVIETDRAREATYGWSCPASGRKTTPAREQADADLERAYGSLEESLKDHEHAILEAAGATL